VVLGILPLKHLTHVATFQRRVAALRSNLGVLTATSFLGGIHLSILGVVWQPFVLSLGASVATLGVLNSIGGHGGIVTTLVQPFGGWLADRVGRKPFVVLSSLAILSAFILYLLAALWHEWRLVIPAVVLMGLSALARPARGALTAESVREGRRGTAYSLVMLATMAPGIFVPPLGGALADSFGYIVIFPISLAVEALVLALIVAYLRETPSSRNGRLEWSELWRVVKNSFIPAHGLRWFYLAMAGDAFFWGMGWGLLYGMATKTYGFTTAQLGIMASLLSASWAVTQLPIGRLIDRYGAKVFLVLSEILGLPCLLAWILFDNFEAFAVGALLFGVVGSTWMPAVMTWLAARVPAEERSEAIGRLSAFRGLLSFPGPALGGFLFEWGGLRAPILANLVGVVLLIGVLGLFVPEPSRSEPGLPA